MIRIPDELASLAAERRLIPFLGAGFSAPLGLPSWEQMLRDVCSRVEGSVPFDQVLKSTGGDLLQVAEYLYLRHDRQIGPIRRQIERSFSANQVAPLNSGPHVELINLGAGQIYTTNYDDIIEQSYRDLGLPVTPVILPKDVALADPDRTQVVKYHGDLAHERTLVLTESAYYKRLDFESPMDLKFRSDLLGKSVLFMGYSFRDVNIRIIWFKLMDMMRDIPEADRRPSYIVRFDPDPTLEELYSAVGLKTIVLSNTPVKDSKERTALLGEFLLKLSARSSTHARKFESGDRKVFVSRALLDVITRTVDLARGQSNARTVRAVMSHFSPDDPLLERLFAGEVPLPLQTDWESTVAQLLPLSRSTPQVLASLDRLSPSVALTSFVAQVLSEPADDDARAAKRRLLKQDDVWAAAWKSPLTAEQAWEIVDGLEWEVRYQAAEGTDDDLAFAVDLSKRIEEGVLTVDGEDADEIRERATLLLAAATRLYPEVADLVVDETARPDVDALLAAIKRRGKKFSQVALDIPDRDRAKVVRRGRDEVLLRTRRAPRASPSRPKL